MSKYKALNCLISSLFMKINRCKKGKTYTCIQGKLETTTDQKTRKLERSRWSWE